MAKYKSAGTTLDYTPSSAASAGDVVVLGDLVAVVTHDIAANALGAVSHGGVYELPKGSDTIAQGDAVYWDGSEVTTTSTSNAFAGHAAAAAASGVGVVEVLLNV
jgi:predicted RecA/RadA family phage recombinase